MAFMIVHTKDAVSPEITVRILENDGALDEFEEHPVSISVNDWNCFLRRSEADDLASKLNLILRILDRRELEGKKL